MDINFEEDSKSRKSASGQDFEDDFDERSTPVRDANGRKNSHSEIEKRRRDKMNMHITELAGILPSILPMSRSKSQRLDKLSVLKLTVQYIKTIQSTANSNTEGRYSHPLLSDRDLNNLFNRITDSFVFAVSCDRGEIIHVSKSVTQVLSYSPEDLIKNNLFDYVHPKDVPKLKEQLLSSGIWYKDSNIKEETSKICSGARRSFFCRMKHKEQLNDKSEADSITDSMNGQLESRYSVIECTGYLKPWKQINKFDNLNEKNLDVEENDGDVLKTLFAPVKEAPCLVAVGTVVNTSTSTSNLSETAKPSQFSFKFTIDGKFLTVDHNITFILGFLPQELLGTSMFEYFHPADIPRLIDVHKATLQECSPKNTEIYKFRAKDNTYMHLRSEWKSFRNPWTKEIDFITAKNHVIRPKLQSSIKPEYPPQGFLSQSNIFQEQLLIGSQYLQPNFLPLENQIKSNLEACEIGKCLTNAYLERKKEVFDIESTPSQTQHDLTEKTSNEDGLQSLRSTMAVFNDPCTSSSRCDDTYGSHYTVSANSAVQDNANLPSTASTYGQSVEDALSDVMTSPSQPWSGSDTNDAVDMAVLMNMLEAEAGLGGSIDHSGFPWPLP